MALIVQLLVVILALSLTKSFAQGKFSFLCTCIKGIVVNPLMRFVLFTFEVWKSLLLHSRLR